MSAAVIHFCGLIPGGPADEAGLQARLHEVLRPVTRGFGGLAAGADIVVAEALLAQGAPVSAVLPFPPDEYLTQSVLPAGAEWVARYERCLGRVELTVLGARYTDDLDYAMASSRAMGLARLHAGLLGAACWQLAVWDGGGSGPAGTAADVQRWRRTGETLVLPSPWPRRMRGGGAMPGATRSAHALLWAKPPGPGAWTGRRLATPDEAAACALTLAADPAVCVMLDYAAPDGAAPAALAPGVIHATEAFVCEFSLGAAFNLWSVGLQGEGQPYVLAAP